MPELPEVEIWRENLERWIVGRRILSASVGDALLRGSQPRRKVEAALAGATIQKISRRGKFLLFDLGARRPELLVHLGMTGTFERVARNAPLPKFTRVVLELSRGERLAFLDARRLGELFGVGAADLQCQRLFLGIKAKQPVAVAMDNLNFMRDGNGTLYLYTQFTEDQLENAPEYNSDTYAENRDTMRIENQGQMSGQSGSADGTAEPTNN